MEGGEESGMSGLRSRRLSTLLVAGCFILMLLPGSSAGDLCFSGSYSNGTECWPCVGKPVHSRWTYNGAKCGWLCDIGYTESNGICLPCAGECRSYDVELLQLSQLGDQLVSLELMFEFCSVLCERVGLVFMDILSPANKLCLCAFKQFLPVTFNSLTEPEKPSTCAIFPAEPSGVTKMLDIHFRQSSSPSNVLLDRKSPDSATLCYQVAPATADAFCFVYGNLTSGVSLIRSALASSAVNVSYSHMRSTFMPLLTHRETSDDKACGSCLNGRFLTFNPAPTSIGSTQGEPSRLSSFRADMAGKRLEKMFACARLVKSLRFPYFCLNADIEDACYAISFAGETLKAKRLRCWSVELACDDCSAPAGWYASALNFTTSGQPLLNQSCKVECPSEAYTLSGWESTAYGDSRPVTVCYEKRAWSLLRAAYVLPVALGIFIIAVATHYERKMKESLTRCAECGTVWTDNTCPIDGFPLSQKLTMEDLGIEMEEIVGDEQSVSLGCSCTSEELAVVMVCGHGSCKYESCSNCGCCWHEQGWVRSSLWWIPLPFLTLTCIISWNIGAAFYIGDWLSWTKFWWTLFACFHALLLVIYLRTCAYKAKCLRNDCCPCYSPIPMKKFPEGFQNVLVCFFVTFTLQLMLTLLTLQLDSELVRHYGGCWWVDCLMYTHVDYRAFCPLCSDKKMLYSKIHSNLNNLLMMFGFPIMIVSLVCCIRTLYFSLEIGIRLCCTCANRRIYEFSYFSGCYKVLYQPLELIRWPRSCSRCRQRMWKSEKMLDSFLHQRRTNILVGLLKRVTCFVTLRRFFEGARQFSYKSLGSSQNDRLDIEMTVSSRQQRRKPSAPVVMGWKDNTFLTFMKSERTGGVELVYDGNPLPKLIMLSKLPEGFLFDESTGDLRWDLPEEQKREHYHFDLIATNYVGECRYPIDVFFSADPRPPAALSYACSGSVRCRCGGILTRYAGWGIKVVCNLCSAVGEIDRLDWFVCRAAGCTYDICPRCAVRNHSSSNPEEAVFQVYRNVDMRAWGPLTCFFPGFPSPTFFAADLPDGLTIEGSSGKISGVPSACAVWMVTVTAANAAGACETRILVEVVSFEPPHDLNYTNVSPAFTGNQFSFDESQIILIDDFQAPASRETHLIPSWGGTITSFSIHPALPVGVHIDEETGVISGVARSAMSTTSFTVMGRGPGRLYCCANVRLKFARVFEPKIAYPDQGMRKIPLGSLVRIEPIRTQTSTPSRFTNPLLLPRQWIQDEPEPEPGKFETHLVCVRIDVRPPLPEGLAVDEDANIHGVAKRPTPATTYSVVVRNEKGFSSSEVSFEILRADGRPATKPRSKILAFFTTPQGYESVNVHGEAQEMMRKHMEPEFAFDCDVNPQPTFSDFKKFLSSQHGFNVRVLHFAGHGEQNFGFIWNEELPSIATPAVYDVGELCDIVGRVAAGQALTGTVECVVLNACQTEVLGKRLRGAGVRNVVCWRTKVKDTTAMIFTDAFYDHFMGKEEIAQNDYREAFLRAKERIQPARSSGDVDAPSRALVRKVQSRSNVDLVVLLSARGDVLPESEQELLAEQKVEDSFN